MIKTVKYFTYLLFYICGDYNQGGIIFCLSCCCSSHFIESITKNYDKKLWKLISVIASQV